MFHFSLGKTIQTVVRIVDGPPSKEDRRNGWARSTLWVTLQEYIFLFSYFIRVICPVALIGQWAQEINKYTGNGLRVIQHYGPNRTNGTQKLSYIDKVKDLTELLRRCRVIGSRTCCRQFLVLLLPLHDSYDLVQLDYFLSGRGFGTRRLAC